MGVAHSRVNRVLPGKTQLVVQSLDQCFSSHLGPCPPTCRELWLPVVPSGCACLFLGLFGTQVCEGASAVWHSLLCNLL